MSMGDLPPRQKMISMMYLVLLALLAMNVSKEILNSFVIINDGLERTNEGFEHKNAYTMAEFGKKAALDPEKVRKYYIAAKQVRDLSKEADEFIRDLKSTIISKVEQIPYEVADTLNLMMVASKDNHDVPTSLLIGPDANNPVNHEQSGVALMMRLDNFNKTIRQYISDVLPIEDVEGMDLEIRMDDMSEGDQTVTWLVGNFYHMPIASVITNMTRLQAEIKNVEAEVLRTLFSKISADDFTFDNLKIAVKPTNGTYITVGDSFKAEVLIAAYSTTSDPILDIGEITDSVGFKVDNPDSTNVSYNNGIATYAVVPRSAGEFEWGGVLRVQKPNGDLISYPFSSVFTAAEPSLVVSPTKMNVFYRGLSNPISVAVPGVSSDKLSVSVSNAQSKKTKDGFDVLPGNGKECKVTVTAEVNGRKQAFPPKLFRVKPVPPPTPEVMGKKGSFNLNKAQLKGVQVVVAKLEDFLFDLKYLVTSFEMSVTVGGMRQDLKSPNNRLTSKMKSILSKMKPGQSVVFKKITAKRFPNGKPELLNGSIIIDII